MSSNFRQSFLFVSFLSSLQGSFENFFVDAKREASNNEKIIFKRTNQKINEGEIRNLLFVNWSRQKKKRRKKGGII